MSDWQVGDLALCVHRDIIECDVCIHDGSNVGSTSSFEVSAIFVDPDCGCICLHGCVNHLDGVLAARCRKIRPDEHEACEPEFVTLLKRSKHTVPA